MHEIHAIPIKSISFSTNIFFSSQQLPKPPVVVGIIAAVVLVLVKGCSVGAAAVVGVAVKCLFSVDVFVVIPTAEGNTA